MLQIITNTPNKMNEVFFGNLPASFAESGAATNPPIISAKMVCQ